jgi:hypothetical protein
VSVLLLLCGCLVEQEGTRRKMTPGTRVNSEGRPSARASSCEYVLPVFLWVPVPEARVILMDLLDFVCHFAVQEMGDSGLRLVVTVNRQMLLNADCAGKARFFLAWSSES